MKTKIKSREEKVDILVVEDSPTQAETVRYLLEQNGYRVSLAANGKEALAMLTNFSPSLVMSDIVMPEIDGYALCKSIKSNENMAHIPVVLVTTLSNAHDVVKALECGADNFIRKPYDEKYLLSRIKYILINRELRKVQKMQMGVEIHLGGKIHFITCERQQIVDLLISIYEEAIHINQELEVRQKELAHSNQALNGLYRIAEGLNQCKTVEEVINKALERAMELPGVSAGWVYLRESLNSVRRCFLLDSASRFVDRA